MNVCGSCKKTVHRTRWVPSATEWVGVDCGCLRERAVRSLSNPFADLVLQHVHNERGEPVRVTSIHQLREAEKRYHFSHHVANHMEANFDAPKQQRTYSVGQRVAERMARMK